MKTSEFFLGPERPLTRDELDAMQSIKAGVKLSEAAYSRLELSDLIAKSLDPGRWALTEAGETRLAEGQ
jgi:hypothetical protein